MVVTRLVDGGLSLGAVERAGFGGAVVMWSGERGRSIRRKYEGRGFGGSLEINFDRQYGGFMKDEWHMMWKGVSCVVEE